MNSSTIIILLLLIGSIFIFFSFQLFGQQLVYDMFYPPSYIAGLGQVGHVQYISNPPFELAVILSLFSFYLPAAMVIAGLMLTVHLHKNEISDKHSKISKLWYAVTPSVFFLILLAYSYIAEIFSAYLHNAAELTTTLSLFIFFLVSGISLIIAYTLKRDYSFSRNILLISVILVLIIPTTSYYFLIPSSLVIVLPLAIYLTTIAFYNTKCFGSNRRIAIIILALLTLTIFLIIFFWPHPLCC